MGATWKTKADAAGRSDATPHLCGIFPSFLFSSISALAESEQGMRLSHSYGLRSKTMPGFGILALCGYGALRRGATGGSLRWAFAGAEY